MLFFYAIHAINYQMYLLAKTSVSINSLNSMLFFYFSIIADEFISKNFHVTFNRCYFCKFSII